jgi:hypothetical protein
MNKRLLLVFALLAMPVMAQAQHQWAHVPDWPGDGVLPNFGGNGAHGVTVAPDGRVWIQPFGATESIDVPGLDPTARMTAAIYVLNPDGSHAPFSPIKFVTVGGVTDTLGGRRIRNAEGNLAWSVRDGRGLETDHNGNILVSQLNRLYRINYQTGEGMNMVEAPRSLTKPAVDEEGNIYTASVVGGNPIVVYGPDFGFLGNAVDAVFGFSRAFEVSPDGNSIYWAGYTTHAVVLYERPDEFSPFDSVGVAVYGVDSESFAWHPTTGHLWIAAGSPNDAPNRYTEVVTNWRAQTWYAFDPAELDASAQPMARDSLTWSGGGAGRPRGLSFSPDGMTAYAVQFSQGTPAIQKFEARPVSNDPEVSLPQAFTLEQNYPNPFNPSTKIEFNLANAGQVSLRVYDVLGREVATLVNSMMPAGEHFATFEAGNLPSGTYMYVLEMNGLRKSATMTLIK